MHMHITPDIPDRPLPASVVPSGTGRLFASIDFGCAYINLYDAADCDRLIVAAVNAKRMLLAAISGERHEFAANPDRHCVTCGLLGGNVIHQVPCPPPASLGLLLPDCARCHHPVAVHVKACCAPECGCAGWRSAHGMAVDAAHEAAQQPLTAAEIAALDAAAAADACAVCGHLVCDCGDDSGEDVTDSIAEGHDAGVPADADDYGRVIADVAAEQAIATGRDADGLEDAAAQDDDEALPDCAACGHPEEQHGPGRDPCEADGCKCPRWQAAASATGGQ